VRAGLRRLGWSMITLGFFTLYFLVYQLFGTNAVTSQAQASLQRELSDSFQAAPKRPQAAAAGPVTRAADLPAETGEPFARLKIPKLEAEHVVVEGAGREELRKGPGRIASTKLPGERGTFAIAGHRTTYGGPFYHLDRLTKGDELIVETRYATFTYTVSRTRIVAPTEVSVLRDVAGQDGKPKPQIVLSTCNPRFSAKQRLIVFGDLTSATPRGAAKGGSVAA
jgi:sortase A